MDRGDAMGWAKRRRIQGSVRVGSLAVVGNDAYRGLHLESSEEEALEQRDGRWGAHFHVGESRGLANRLLWACCVPVRPCEALQIVE